jgi:hypothetical protein
MMSPLPELNYTATTAPPSLLRPKLILCALHSSVIPTTTCNQGGVMAVQSVLWAAAWMEVSAVDTCADLWRWRENGGLNSSALLQLDFFISSQ